MQKHRNIKNLCNLRNLWETKNIETMKKTYIAPACEIVKLNAADIIATSFNAPNDYMPDGGDDNSFSRDGDFFDFEEW